MRYLSLFSGIGGFELGIRQAYVAITNGEADGGGKGSPKKGSKARTGLVAKARKISRASRRWNGELPDGIRDERAPYCAGYSEIDRHAVGIYERHFPNHKNYGDITKLDPKTLPDFDLLCGGFPCQAFSIAGLRRGFDDTRGTLFFDIARILREKRPRLLLLENVKGLLSHDGGRTFKTIVATLTDLGYDLEWQVLNSKNHGVPQNRERVFIVGCLRGSARPKVFPIGEGHSIDDTVRKIQDKERPRSSCLSTRYGQRWTDETYIGTFRTHKDGQGFRKSKSGLSPTIPARAREDGSGQPIIVQRGRGKNNGGNHSIAPTMTGKSYTDNNFVGGSAVSPLSNARGSKDSPTDGRKA